MATAVTATDVQIRIAKRLKEVIDLDQLVLVRWHAGGFTVEVPNDLKYAKGLYKEYFFSLSCQLRDKKEWSPEVRIYGCPEWDSPIWEAVGSFLCSDNIPPETWHFMGYIRGNFREGNFEWVDGLKVRYFT